MVKVSPPSLLPVARVASRIYLLRNQKVMLDFDLAELYGVPTKAFNQAVTRNAERFPEDCMFRLSRQEAEAMHRSHIVTGSQKHRDPRFTPRAFTQEGVAMLSGVLLKSMWPSCGRLSVSGRYWQPTRSAPARWRSTTGRLPPCSSTSQPFWNPRPRRKNLPSALCIPRTETL